MGASIDRDEHRDGLEEARAWSAGSGLSRKKGEARAHVNDVPFWLIVPWLMAKWRSQSSECRVTAEESR